MVSFRQYVEARGIEMPKGNISGEWFSKHGYPMVVVRSRQKQQYLEALHRSDLKVGSEPSVGVKATIKQIKPFQKHMTELMAHEIEMDHFF